MPYRDKPLSPRWGVTKVRKTWVLLTKTPWTFSYSILPKPNVLKCGYNQSSLFHGLVLPLFFGISVLIVYGFVTWQNFTGADNRAVEVSLKRDTSKNVEQARCVTDTASAVHGVRVIQYNCTTTGTIVISIYGK